MTGRVRRVHGQQKVWLVPGGIVRILVIRVTGCPRRTSHYWGHVALVVRREYLSFATFMSGAAERGLRILAGVALIVVGIKMGHVGGIIVAVVGLVPLYAGVLRRDVEEAALST